MRQAWEDRAIKTQDLGRPEPRLVRQTCCLVRLDFAQTCLALASSSESARHVKSKLTGHYESEIARRLLDKAQDEAARETWQTQVDVLEMLAGMTEGDLTEQREELALCEATVAGIEADLAEEDGSISSAHNASH